MIHAHQCYIDRYGALDPRSWQSDLTAVSPVAASADPLLAPESLEGAVFFLGSDSSLRFRGVPIRFYVHPGFSKQGVMVVCDDQTVHQLSHDEFDEMTTRLPRDAKLPHVDDSVPRDLNSHHWYFE